MKKEFELLFLKMFELELFVLIVHNFRRPHTIYVSFQSTKNAFSALIFSIIIGLILHPSIRNSTIHLTVNCSFSQLGLEKFTEFT